MFPLFQIHVILLKCALAWFGKIVQWVGFLPFIQQTGFDPCFTYGPLTPVLHMVP